MKTINRLLEKFKTIFLLLLGIFFSCMILWNKIFRLRIPKDIPFIFTEILFIFLLIVCISYFYAFCHLLFFYKKKSNNIFIEYLYYPLEYLYRYILKQQFFKIFVEIMLTRILNYHKQILILFVYLFHITESIKIFISIIFILDVFYKKHLEYIYEVIPLLLFVLFFNILAYFIKDRAGVLKQFLEEHALILAEDKETNYSENFVNEKIYVII